MPLITISRQYGSLGDDIGSQAARRLGSQFVDQETINEIARRLDLPEETVTTRDEWEGRLVPDLVRTMRRVYPATRLPQPTEERPEIDEAAYLQIIRQVMWEIARTNNAVIVGRGSTHILAHHPDILHVLLIAPVDVRVERVMAAEALNHQQALQRVRQIDENRGRYVRHYYGTNWLDLRHYNLVIDTGHFSELRATSLVCAAVTPEAESA